MRTELGSWRAVKTCRTSFGDNQSLWCSLFGISDEEDDGSVDKDGFLIKVECVNDWRIGWFSILVEREIMLVCFVQKKSRCLVLYLKSSHVNHVAFPKCFLFFCKEANEQFFFYSVYWLSIFWEGEATSAPKG